MITITDCKNLSKTINGRTVFDVSMNEVDDTGLIDYGHVYTVAAFEAILNDERETVKMSPKAKEEARKILKDYYLACETYPADKGYWFR